MNTELKILAVNMVKQDGRLISDVAQEIGVSNRKVFRWLQENAANQPSFKDEEELIFDSYYIYALG